MAKKKQKSPAATPVAEVTAEADVTASPSTSKPKTPKSKHSNLFKHLQKFYVLNFVSFY